MSSQKIPDSPESDGSNFQIHANQPKKLTKYQLQLSQGEKNLWQEFADTHHRGNLARMIRTLVNQAVVRNDLGEDEDQATRFDRIIRHIEANSERTTTKIESFDDDLMIIKSLLSRLLQGQSERLEYVTSMSSLPLEETVFQQVMEFVESKERAVSINEVLSYLTETSLEARKFIAKEDKKLPAGGKIAISFMLEDVLKQLFERTGNPAYSLEIDKQIDFGRSQYEF